VAKNLHNKLQLVFILAQPQPEVGVVQAADEPSRHPALESRWTLWSKTSSDVAFLGVEDVQRETECGIPSIRLATIIKICLQGNEDSWLQNTKPEIKSIAILGLCDKLE